MTAFLKRLLKSEEGNALIMVVFLTLVMLLIAGAVMAISFSNVEVSDAYKKTSNLYYVAESAAEKLLDNANKILIAEMPKLMKEASDEAKATAFTENYKYLVFEDSPDDPADSVYKHNFYLVNEENEKNKLYEDKLSSKAFELIDNKFSSEPESLKIEYEVKDGRNKIYVEGYFEKIPDPAHPTGYKDDALLLKVKATLKNGADILSEFELEGDVVLAELKEHEEILLEEYRWKGDYTNPDAPEYNLPNVFRTPVLTFGDFVVTDGAEVTVDGDLRARGYVPPPLIDGAFPELEQYGGVYVSNGSKLTVDGDVITLANVHTIADTGSSVETNINISGDVIAHSVVIEDDYPGLNPGRGINDKISGHTINIGGDVYVDNDVAIDRYAESCNINIAGNLFGISNRPGSNNDPNNASGVYCIGKDSLITIGGNAFVHGQAWISFNNGRTFSRLYESIGEPYEEVDYLDKYRIGDPAGDPIYLRERKDYIKNNKVILLSHNNSSNYFYAPERINASGHFYKVTDIDYIGLGEELINSHGNFDEQHELENLLNKGGVSSSQLLQINSNWASDAKAIPGTNNGVKALDVIASSSEDYKDYLKGEGPISPFKRNYFADGGTSFDSMGAYRGIEGYMFIKRDIFLKDLNTNSPTIDGMVNYMDFNKDIVYAESESGGTTTAYTDIESVTWSEDNPVYFTDTGSGAIEVIDISTFNDGIDVDDPIPTLIVDKGNGTIILTANGSLDKLKALIISNGRVIFDGVSEFEGQIITRGLVNHGDTGYANEVVDTTALVRGEKAGILVRSNLLISHDENIIFKVKCKDYNLKRVVMDYIGLTSYSKDHTDDDKVNKIITIPTIGIEKDQKIELSPESVIYTSNTEAFKGVRFELKTLRIN
ncbi:MAG: hypothetical protein GX327_04770 [Epulopiscium sp.]|nr:hypothetical protein [Candidatus Epulonipiscium sp.]